MDAYPLDWESLWAFIPIVCASIGICITLDVVAVFIIYNRYVSHVLFFGYEKSSTVPLALVRTIVVAPLLIRLYSSSSGPPSSWRPAGS